MLLRSLLRSLIPVVLVDSMASCMATPLLLHRKVVLLVITALVMSLVTTLVPCMMPDNQVIRTMPGVWANTSQVLILESGQSWLTIILGIRKELTGGVILMSLTKDILQEHQERIMPEY